MTKPALIICLILAAIAIPTLTELSITGYQTNQLLKECEKPLSSNQQCVIIAIPKYEDTDK